MIIKNEKEMMVYNGYNWACFSFVFYSIMKMMQMRQSKRNLFF